MPSPTPRRCSPIGGRDAPEALRGPKARATLVMLPRRRAGAHFFLLLLLGALFHHLGRLALRLRLAAVLGGHRARLSRSTLQRPRRAHSKRPQQARTPQPLVVRDLDGERQRVVPPAR